MEVKIFDSLISEFFNHEYFKVRNGSAVFCFFKLIFKMNEKEKKINRWTNEYLYMVLPRNDKLNNSESYIPNLKHRKRDFSNRRISNRQIFKPRFECSLVGIFNVQSFKFSTFEFGDIRFWVVSWVDLRYYHKYTLKIKCLLILRLDQFNANLNMENQRTLTDCWIN